MVGSMVRTWILKLAQFVKGRATRIFIHKLFVSPSYLKNRVGNFAESVPTLFQC